MIETRIKINPILSFILSLLIFFIGLSIVKEKWFYHYYISILILYILLGFGLAYLKTFLFFLPLGMIYILVTYVGNDLYQTDLAFRRILALGLSSTLSLTIDPSSLSRSLSKLKISKSMGIGLLIVINFIRLIKQEIIILKNAIYLRGIRFFKQPILWLKSFSLPLLIRLISISDNMTRSLEVRRFSTETGSTAYKSTSLKSFDYLLIMGIVFINVFFVLKYFGVI